MAKDIWKGYTFVNHPDDNALRTAANIRKQPDWKKRYAKANYCRQEIMDCFPDMTEEQLDDIELTT